MINPAINVRLGANRGNVTDLFLWQYENPIIHVFEPIPNLAAALEKKYKRFPSVTVHAAALGARESTVSFHVVNNQVSSSGLQYTETFLEHHFPIPVAYMLDQVLGENVGKCVIRKVKSARHIHENNALSPWKKVGIEPFSSGLQPAS